MASIRQNRIPNVQCLLGDGSLRSIITGQKANPETNPITKKHFRNLLKTLRRLDTKGIYHGDIDPAHTFYQKDGTVKLDFLACGKLFNFRDSKALENGPPPTPKFMMPSNAFMFEHASLGQYLSQINDQEKSGKLFEDYLKSTAEYHKERLIYLESQPEVLPEMLEYERLQAEFLKQPSEEIVDLRKKRLDTLHLNREAFTDWDEGGGACGHKKDPKRQAQSIFKWLDTITASINYTEAAKTLEAKAENPKLKKYFSYERRLGEFLTETYTSWASGMSDWACRQEIMNADENSIKLVNKNFNKFKEASSSSGKLNSIQIFKDFYGKVYEDFLAKKSQTT